MEQYELHPRGPSEPLLHHRHEQTPEDHHEAHDGVSMLSAVSSTRSALTVDALTDVESITAVSLESIPHPEPTQTAAAAVNQSLTSGNVDTREAPQTEQTPDIEEAPEPETPEAEAPEGLNGTKVRADRTIREELWEWKYELAAVLLYITMLAAIVATIYPQNGRPLPQWPLGITSNALLSVYAVTFKASMSFVVASSITQRQWTWFAAKRSLYSLAQYHEAGQGGWGSVRWLSSHRLREPLAALGAIILVVGIAIDPFVQQIIQHEDCSAEISQTERTASLPRTTFFNPPMTHMGAGGDSMPGREEQAAFISGIFSPSAPVSFECLTGNCTFSTEYSTVGYCSHCEDLSDRLSFRGECAKASCNSTTSLPSGFSVAEIGGLGLINLISMSWAENKNGDMAYEIIQRKAFKDGRDPTTATQVEGCDNPASNNTWQCRGYGAASCSLSPCVRTYKATVTNGLLSETMISASDPGLSWGMSSNMTTNSRGRSLINAVLDTKCISPEERDHLKSAGYLLDDAQARWLPYNLTFETTFNISKSVPSNALFPWSLIAHDCLYMINRGFKNGFEDNFLRYFLSGTLKGQLTPAMVVGTIDGPQVLQQMYNFSHNDFSTVDRLFQNAAESLTARIRQAGEVHYSQPATGVVYHYATCLRVDWVWLTFPTTLAAGTIILLIFTIVSTAGAQAPIWKSSPLALLFHGRDASDWFVSSGSQPPSWQDCKSANSRSTMERLSKEVEVQLDGSEPLIRLVRV